ncbi:hypothetical protein [Jannaschia sp. CCS1]|uniref:hypothetical protein n=1 Tax=Jannaschia sp. (strain CCS1) TaxID=290400 RepID=UPI0000539FE6|nr:hypothetical protein [Jannaschia sp. CCS1]ABD57013.1 hypothetical protein Jann_4096 [Jannaschia sp. CCS1]
MAGLKACLFSTFCGVCLAAISIWVDLVALSAILIALSALVLPVLYGATSRFLIIRVVIGVVGAIIGLASLWLLRYGLEFSWSGLAEQVQLGPAVFIDHFMSASDRFQTASGVDGARSSEGPSPKMMAWMGGTAILGMMPVLGAVQGPKAMQAWHYMRDRWQKGRS